MAEHAFNCVGLRNFIRKAPSYSLRYFTGYSDCIQTTIHATRATESIFCIVMPDGFPLDVHESVITRSSNVTP